MKLQRIKKMSDYMNLPNVFILSIVSIFVHLLIFTTASFVKFCIGYNKTTLKPFIKNVNKSNNSKGSQWTPCSWPMSLTVW